MNSRQNQAIRRSPLPRASLCREGALIIITKMKKKLKQNADEKLEGEMAVD